MPSFIDFRPELVSRIFLFALFHTSFASIFTTPTLNLLSIMPGPGSRNKTKSKGRKPNASAHGDVGQVHIAEIDNAEGWNTVVNVLCDLFQLRVCLFVNGLHVLLIVSILRSYLSKRFETSARQFQSPIYKNRECLPKQPTELQD